MVVEGARATHHTPKEGCDTGHQTALFKKSGCGWGRSPREDKREEDVVLNILVRPMVRPCKKDTHIFS